MTYVKNLINILSLLLMGLAFTDRADAEITALHFEATVTQVSGTPFGINALAGVTHVNGTILYDQGFSPETDSFANMDSFSSSLINGIDLTIGTSIIQSSDYHLITGNNYGSVAGYGDHFEARANTVSGDHFTVDGNNSSSGYIRLNFGDNDATMFPSNASLSTLPSLATLTQEVDRFAGRIVDFAGGGQIEFSFQGIPEPSSYALILSGVTGLGFVRRRMRW